MGQGRDWVPNLKQQKGKGETLHNNHPVSNFQILWKMKRKGWFGGDQRGAGFIKGRESNEAKRHN